MILVDTSIWIDHLHAAESQLVELLESASVVQHPMVVGELAVGVLSQRRLVLDSLNELPELTAATHDEVMFFVDERQLFGRGLSLVDAHLLASVTLTPQARLWTRDKKLEAFAKQLGLAFAVEN